MGAGKMKFVIVGPPRSGTTLLVKTLNQLQGVLCHGELLQDLVRGLEDGFEALYSTQAEREERMQRLLAHRNEDQVGFVQRAFDCPAKAVGMKVLYKTFLNPKWGPAIAYLSSQDELSYIHIRRRNALRRYISESVMKAGGPIHSGLGGRGDILRPVHIDVHAFLESQSALSEQEAAVMAITTGKPVLNLVYEQLSSDFAGTMTQVCRYIGLDITGLSIEPALQKVGARDLQNVVSNYHELLAHDGMRAMLLEG
jgi:LPS sulfotransferase NodH